MSERPENRRQELLKRLKYWMGEDRWLTFVEMLESGELEKRRQQFCRALESGDMEQQLEPFIEKFPRHFKANFN